jgi:hypothetical protein
MNQNGNHDHVAVAEISDRQAIGNGNSTGFYDPTNPALKSATPLETGRKKSWKRKLFSLCLGLIFIGGVFVALYLLLRVNRVNVRVNGDSKREATTVKPQTNSANAENALTAEAIDMARQAAGADNARSGATPSPSPSASPVPSPSYVKTNYAYTGNLSPTNEGFNNNGSGNSNQQNAAGNGEQRRVESSTEATMQSQANSTVSLFVDDAPPKSSPSPQVVSSLKINSRIERAASKSVPEIAPAVLPPFGTMLPVRTQGVIFSLRDNSYARLELVRDFSGQGWSLPRGTVFIGRTSGSGHDRAFVNVIGYIDPRENKLVKVTGDVLGSDGATGIQGKTMGVDRNRLKQTLGKVASSGLQVAGLMSGALGRGTVILDRSGYGLPDEMRGLSNSRSNRDAYVKVAAGQSASVMIADLPKPMQAVDAPGDDELARAAVFLTDREVMELILFGTPEDIRAATPMMSVEQKKLVLKTLIPEDEKR